MRLADIWAEYGVLALDRTFTYRADDERIQRGMRVWIPLNGQRVIGFVECVHEDERDQAMYEQQMGFRLLKVESRIDEAPVLNEELMRLGRWLAKETITPVISCYQCMVPPPLKPVKTHKATVKDVYAHFVKDVEGLTKKQSAMLETIKANDRLRRDCRNESTSIMKKLLDVGAIVYIEKERKAIWEEAERDTEKPLTEAQATVLDQLRRVPASEVALLHGVTGSGKTEVYLRLAQEVCRQGRQVLILVPEISLTPQMINRVKARFGAQVAIYHSGLNAQEKFEQYQAIRERRAQVAVATRSGVFLPFCDLGLIVLDEEHDHSYKQDKAPQYHARDVALRRALFHRAKVVLGSATPSLESYARTLRGRYALCTLPNRVHGTLPKVRVVDMKNQIRGGYDILSKPLIEALQMCLNQHQQAIVLLNRRGYAPALRCETCGEVVRCRHCDVAMSYHKDDQLLKCHICGESMAVPAVCPNCGARAWKYVGIGTQRLQEELQRRLPQARLLRLDADEARKKGAHKKILSAFEQQEADILLGTQMIAKGLDFPNVTLVGILQADAALNYADFRSAEQTFDLLVQASGRSGRSAKAGQVIIQAYDPSHYAIQTAIKQDYEAFFRQEMQYRHIAQYPPYTYFISIVASGLNEQKCREIMEKVKSRFIDDPSISVLGVSQLLKRRNEYRYRVLLRGKDLTHMKETVYAWYQGQRSASKSVTFEIDVNPMALEG